MLFENKKHMVYTVNKNKIALNRDKDKRLVQTNGITTLGRGYLEHEQTILSTDNQKMFAEKHYDEKLAITLLIVGAGMIAYHFR